MKKKRITLISKANVDRDFKKNSQAAKNIQVTNY